MNALNALGENTADNPYSVKLSGFKLSSGTGSGSTLKTMYDVLNRYVTLDLRDCDSVTYCTASSENKRFIVSVSLGENILGIAANAFAGCAALESITLGSNPPTLGANALPSGHPFAAIYVPSGALATYQNTGASGWTEEMKAMVKNKE
jgi:hypothetical protein